MEYIKLFEEFVNEGKDYKLGDKYSSDFDYDGMLEMGSKAKVSWGAKKLQKLQDSFTDVNYHSESKGLGIAIDYIEDGDKKGAVYYMDMFNDACKDSWSESVNEGKLDTGDWKDYTARYNGVDINLKNGYKYLKDHELEDLYTKIGKLLKGKTTMAKRVDVVFESVNEAKDLTSLQRNLDKLQNDYEDLLDDEDLDALSNLIVKLNSKIKNK